MPSQNGTHSYIGDFFSKASAPLSPVPQEIALDFSCCPFTLGYIVLPGLPLSELMCCLCFHCWISCVVFLPRFLGRCFAHNDSSILYYRATIKQNLKVFLISASYHQGRFHHSLDSTVVPRTQRILNTGGTDRLHDMGLNVWSFMFFKLTCFLEEEMPAHCSILSGKILQ